MIHNRIKQIFKEWNVTTVVDPFAGEGDLFADIENLYKKNINKIGYDIDEKIKIWKSNDSLKAIKKHKNAIIVTNPPYFSKISAATQKNNYILKYFKNSKYSDLYQIAIEKVLEKYDRAVFIVPETFLNKKVQHENIRLIEILESNPFEDTTVPVCVVVFDKKHKKEPIIYKNNWSVKYGKFIKKRNSHRLFGDYRIKFNVKNPNIRIIGFDGVKNKDCIKFVSVKDFKQVYNLNKIKKSSRVYYTAKIENFVFDHNFISSLNIELSKIRKNMKSISLSPFKGYNEKSKTRRRLDFATARFIINKIKQQE